MKTIMITGADGYLGRNIAAWILAHTNSELILWVRASNEDSLAVKKNALASLLGERCRLVCGDLEQAFPFSAADPRNLNAIIHSAAVTNFNLTREQAEVVNVNGFRRLLNWARQCPELEQVVFLSTLYVSGLGCEQLDEAPIERPKSFANYYEWSKWQAERLLADEFMDLPWQIHRVSTVMAEDNNGKVRQYNVIHNTLRLLYYGLLSVIPGLAGTRVYMTTAAFTAEVCSKLLFSRSHQKVFHIAENGSEAIRLGTVLDLAFDTFMEDREFRNLHILKPLFCDQHTFDALQQGSSCFSEVIGQALRSMSPFAPQLFHDRQVSTSQLHLMLPDLSIPKSGEILPLMCRNLVATGWGRTTGDTA